ncbi:MAG: O-antigen ligase family protein [Vulcanimicrobiaceae bacterium]
MLVWPPPLDTIAFMGFVALFLGVAWASAVRPHYALGALIVCYPFPFTHAFASTTITTGKVALLAALLGLACTDIRLFLPPRMLRWPLLFLLCIGAFDALSAHWAHYPHAAFHEAGKWFEYALLALVAAALWKRDPEARSMRNVVECCTIAIVVVAVIYEFVAPSSFVHIGSFNFIRLSGTLDGPNQCGQFLVSATALLTYYVLADGSRRSQLALWTTLVALALTYSRTSLVAACVVIGVLAWTHRAYLRRLFLPLGAAACTVLLFIGIAVHLSHVTSLSQFAERNYAIAHSGGVGTRSELWHAALVLWKSHPLLGIGADNFTYSLASVGLPAIRTQANNLYFEQLADGGVVLLALTLALLAAVLVITLRRGSGVATAATLGLIAIGLLDNPWYTPAVVAWWCIIVGITTAGNTTGDHNAPQSP